MYDNSDKPLRIFKKRKNEYFIRKTCFGTRKGLKI